MTNDAALPDNELRQLVKMFKHLCRLTAELKIENAILKEKAAKMEILNEEQEKIIQDLHLQLNNAKLASNLSTLEITPENKASIKLQIDQLIGEIDQCLKRLND